MDFGSYIKKVRKDNDLSLREVARRSNISHPYLSQLESGRNKNPTPEIVRKISKGLNIPYMNLMSIAGYGDKDNPIEADSFFELLGGSPSEIEQANKDGTMTVIKDSKEYKLHLDRALKDEKTSIYYKDKLVSKDDKESINQLIDIHLKGR